MKIPFPTFDYEQIHWKNGLLRVAGIDEVGRGAFAGPVVSAAVILPQDFPLDLGIHDSKLLKKVKREYLAEVIREKATAYTIQEISVETINLVGVGKATQQSFAKCTDALTAWDHILMDAFYIDTIEKAKQTPIIKGDQKSLSIAAASIIAKVYRDGLMKELAEEFPEYGFETHVGYGTSKHREAIRLFGISKHHRTVFCKNSI
jgi:ribonuclease HII